MKSMVLIPTFNEAENIIKLINKILMLNDNIEVLVIDDNSSDGTWQKVKSLANKNYKVHLLHRLENRGRGLAGVAGFKYALKKGADYIIEMDADFSHDPKYIPEFLNHIREYDVVIGSRYLRNEKNDKRSFFRKDISKSAKFLIKILFRFNVSDPTSAYRCFKKKTLESIGLDDLKSKGPIIIIEILERCFQKNCRIKEIPIVFHKRKYGYSKLNLFILADYFFKLFRLRYRLY